MLFFLTKEPVSLRILHFFVLKLCFILILYLNTCSGQTTDSSPQLDPNLTVLKLYGPDDDLFLDCVTPSTYLVSTHIDWYVNGDKLKSQLLPQGERHAYENMNDIIDLLGNYPATVQCKLTEKDVTETELESNMIIWVRR